jgi:hypothetical protein
VGLVQDVPRRQGVDVELRAHASPTVHRRNLARLRKGVDAVNLVPGPQIFGWGMFALAIASVVIGIVDWVRGR